MGINPDKEFIQELQQVFFQLVFILEDASLTDHYFLITYTGVIR